jgi:CBS domain containing-hemolysin-like protein
VVWLEIGLLVLLFSATLLLGLSLQNLPAKERHRRARSDLPGNRAAKRISLLAAYGLVAKVFIWLAAVASIASLLIWAVRTSIWLGLTVLIFENLAGLVINKFVVPGNWLFNLAGYLAVTVAWLLHWLDGLWAHLPQPEAKDPPSRIYELEDLIGLLDRQPKQIENRISAQNLATAKAALQFNDKKVADLAVKLKDVRLVLPDESVGPHLMDELYAAGHSVFPVGKKVGKKLPPELSGVVYLDDLVANPLRGSVSGLMTPGLDYIGSEQPLAEAVKLFLKRHTTLLIVNDERDQPAAILWLEDVLENLLGRPIKPEPDNPADADAREKMVE